MKSNLLKVFASLLLFSTAGHAGGSSVAGIGAPEFIYVCYEMNFHRYDPSNNDQADFEVNIGKFYPKYQLTLSVIDRKAPNMSSEPTVEKISKAIGGPISYLSRNYQLYVRATTTPIFENGHVFHYSELTYKNRPYKTLKCERVKTN